MGRIIDLTKVTLEYRHQFYCNNNSIMDEYPIRKVQLEGNEKTVKDIYDPIIEFEAEENIGSLEWISDIECEETTIYYKGHIFEDDCFRDENGEEHYGPVEKEKEEDVTIAIYAEIEDEYESEWVYIPYSNDPITEVEVDM